MSSTQKTRYEFGDRVLHGDRAATVAMITEDGDTVRYHLAYDDGGSSFEFTTEGLLGRVLNVHPDA